MGRCRWRPKLWICLLTLAVGVLQVLYSIIVHNSNTARHRHFFLSSPFLPSSAKDGHGRNSDHKTAHQKHSISLFSPGPQRDHYVETVGLRGFPNFDCVRAIEGLPVHLHKKSFPAVPKSDEAFAQEKNCPVVLERSGYHRYPPVTEEEAKFPLAFNVLLYKDVEQVHLLLRAIYRPHNTYCLHVDGHAAPAVFEATRRLAACLPNVFLASRRENITYSGFSRLQADINCMEDHWRMSSSQKTPWRYLINLPSQDFPLKTNLEMVKILTIYNGSNDIEGITGNRMLKQRFTYKHVYRPHATSGRLEIVKTDEKHEPPPHNITVVKGSAYGVFSRGFVDYVLHDRRAADLLHWCRAVNSPDEYYWATLHHNPHLNVPGGYNGAPDKKPFLAVYASWPPRDRCESSKRVRGVCIFGVRDLPQLVARRELFANKFYMDFEPETLHCLDQWLVNKTRAVLPFDALYYRQLPFIRH